MLPELLGLGPVHELLLYLPPPPPPPLPLFFPILLFFLFLHLITKYSPPTDVSDSVW